MLDAAKQYPAYKDTGQPWLGEVPEHWEEVKLKYLLNERSEKGHPNEPLLAATQTKGVVLKSEYGNRTVEAMKDLHLLKLVEPDDFVISLRSFQGGIEYARCRGIISPAYTVLFPDDPANHGYLAALFKSKPFVDNLKLYVTGIRQGQNIDYDDLSGLKVPVPSPTEQAAIVKVLSAVDRRVNRLVRAKRRLLALLAEQKQAVITHAVTRGLDPTAPTKPSGVPWLGEVPAHWSIDRFKRYVAFQEGPGIMAADFREDGVPLLRISCVNTPVASLKGCNFLDPKKVATRWKHFRVVASDYLLTASGSTGKVSRASPEVEGAIPYTGIIRLWPIDDRSIDMRFVECFIRSDLFQGQVESARSGVGIEHFGPTHLKRMWMLVPPLDEQINIVDRIIAECAPLDAAAELARREIDLIREYRTRLVADVVTGKLDVRAVAGALPEEAEEEEPIEPDEAEADADADEPELVEELAGH